MAISSSSLLILIWSSLWIYFKSATTTLHSFNITGSPFIAKAYKDFFVFWFTFRLLKNKFFFYFLSYFLNSFLVFWSFLRELTYWHQYTIFLFYFLSRHNLSQLYKFLVDFLVRNWRNKFLWALLLTILAFFFHFRSCIGWCWL